MNDMAYKATKSKIFDAKDKCDDIRAKSLYCSKTVMVVMAEQYCQPEKTALNRVHHQKPIIFQTKTDMFNYCHGLKFQIRKTFQKLI